MKAAEILRKLADMIDTHSDQESAPQVELEPVEVDNTDNTEVSTMVPPLQQKLELLKKATGVESHYDEETPCDSAEDAELALIKQRAGVVDPVVLHVAADDDLLG